MSKKIIDVLKLGYKILKEATIESYSIDAEILLCFVLKTDKLFIHCNQEKLVSCDEEQKFVKLINRRSKNEPIAQIVGYKDFWKNTFLVNKSTLIPRPETELLIEEVMKLFPDKNEQFYFADFGAGTGCIGLSILDEYKNSSCVFVEKSKMATNCIKQNAKRLKLSESSTIHNKSWDKLRIKKKFDFIISNPPYIPLSKKHILMPDVAKFEPPLALFAKNNGIKCYQDILKLGKKFIKRGGYIIFEIDLNHQDIVLPKEYKIIKISNDLLGLPRLMIVQIF